MNIVDIRVNITPDYASELVTNQIVNGNISGELINRYTSVDDAGHTMIVLVFEKYYMRNSSRASLTVTLEDLKDVTKVHAVGSGGGQGLIFKFDWGASTQFSDQVVKALNDYTI